MSNNNLTPPTGGSPSEPKPRAVSGSLKDRIAKFNNPSAAPLVPTHAFGTAGPTAPSSTAGRGLIGNRIPSLDPKTAAMVGGQRKVSENRGLIGNRIPSQSAVPGVGSTGSAGARSNSPAGSVDSSSASGRHPGSSASARTSRSSSPPTSPGGGVPPSLLASTLPETGDPGAMTPSSTRANAGEEVTDFSPPATPNANPELPPSDDNLVRSDLTPNNLPANPIAANPMYKNLQSGAPPSITSSMASQYDSKGSGDQTQMLLDVSGVSTPTGTPRAAHRELEGSLAGSARGEGSVADAEDLSKRLEGMDVREDGKDHDESQVPDRDPTPEPPKMEDETAVKDEPKEDVDMTQTSEKAKDDGTKDSSGQFRDPNGNLVQDKGDGTYVTTDMDADANDLEAEKGHGGAEPVPEMPVDGKLKHDPQGALQDPDAKIEYTTKKEEKPAQAESHVSSPSDERDPNQDDDLDDLKQGKLHHSNSASSPGQPEAGNHTVDQNPVNNLVEASMSQNVVEHRLNVDETKHQGGVAGQRMEDVDNANEVVQPDEAAPPPPRSASNDGGPDIRDATPVSTVDDEPLGPKGALDGPQKFNVEWLEEGRGQTKAADLDEQEYHFKDTPKDDKPSDKNESTERTTQEPASQDQSEDAKSADVNEGESNTPTAAAGDLPPSDQHNDASTLQSQDNKAALLPDAPSTDPKTQTSRPTQINIEPAPIAQPSTDNDNENDNTPGANASGVADVPDTSDEPTPSVEPTSPPKFPNPPSEDPDVVDPISQTQSSFDDTESGVSTPIDPSFVKAFPEVPDEQKPRVEVHVSSPVNTPKKENNQEKAGDDEREFDGNADGNGTPIADLPGTSKSLSYPDLPRSESGLSDRGGISEGDEHKTPEGLDKRLSARRSPKSPLLGDEDPGDFTPGEGWAVVTKGRDL